MKVLGNGWNSGGNTRTSPNCGGNAPPVVLISAQSGAVQAELRALNNVNMQETSFLAKDEWRALVAASFAATCTTGAAALLIALDQDAEYGSVNFKWFQARRRRFVYVDRVVVSERARMQGLATCLYRDLFARARVAGHDHVVCEINLDPPNRGSDAFHGKMGFVEVGRAELRSGGKIVRYWEKLLPGGIRSD